MSEMRGIKHQIKCRLAEQGFEPGSCMVSYEDRTEKKRSPFCPGVLEPEQVIPSPQGWGPARNIIGFTGGDLTCQPEFYCLASEEIKEEREDRGS